MGTPLNKRSPLVSYDDEGNPDHVDLGTFALVRTQILRDKLYALTARVDTIEELLIAQGTIAELEQQLEAKQEAEL